MPFSIFLWAGYGSRTWGQSLYFIDRTTSMGFCGASCPRKLHSSELQGNRNEHWVSPNSHTFGRIPTFFQVDFLMASCQSTSLPPPPGYLSSWKKFLNFRVRNSTPKRTATNVFTRAHILLHTHSTSLPTQLYTPLPCWYFLTHVPSLGLTPSHQAPSHTLVGQHLLTFSTHTPHSR